MSRISCFEGKNCFMTLKIILSMIMVGYLSNIANFEMPLTPNFEELCESSDLIICGEPNEWTKIEEKSDIIAFKVHQVYKGSTNLRRVNVVIPTVYKGKTELVVGVNGIKSTYVTMGDSIIPVYVKGKRYFLFLEKKRFSSYYVRTQIDEVWGERDWNKDQEQQIIDEIKFLSDPDKWKKPGDNILYVIPEGAEEKIVSLTEYQQNNNFSKRAEFWLNGKKVGEKAWYENGQIAYEQPIKNEMEHGNYKVWYPDGKLKAVCPYRKDRLHGIFQQWDEKGHLETSYWIKGKSVKKNEYLKELKNNETLPKIEQQ